MTRRQITWLLPAVCLMLLVACGRRPLLSDEFSTINSGWQLEGDAFSRSYIAQEMLWISVEEANVMHFVTLAQPSVADFVLEVDATLVQGNPGSSSYGVLFRQNGVAFYRFEVAPSGVYNVQKRLTDGSWQSLLPDRRWQYSAAIQTGVGVANRLTVAVSGSTAVFAVNDTVVQRIDNFDAEYASGTVALSAGSFSQGGVAVAFDNLLITTP